MWTMLAGVPGKLKVLADRLTSTRAANLDRLDANVSTRAAAATALSNAVWTDARAGKLDIASLGLSIKSVQSGYTSATVAEGVANTEDDGYINIAIASVNTSKSVVFVNGGCGGSVSQSVTYGSAKIIMGRLTSATNLRVSCPSAIGTDRITVRWYVAEFY